MFRSVYSDSDDSCGPYDPYNDPRGTRGIAEADSIMSSIGYNFSKLPPVPATDFERQLRVALTPLRRHHGKPFADDMRAMLDGLRATGYNVGSYTDLEHRDLWNHINTIRTDIILRARTECPETLRRYKESVQHS